jgi:hypothetical protein
MTKQGETTDPASPLYQATVLGTGLTPGDDTLDGAGADTLYTAADYGDQESRPVAGLGTNDSQIDDDAMGPVNIPPTIDYAQTDPMVDGVEAFTSPMPPPPPGSIANHVHINDADGNMLSDRRYTMFGEE